MKQNAQDQKSPVTRKPDPADKPHTNIPRNDAHTVKSGELGRRDMGVVPPQVAK